MSGAKDGFARARLAPVIVGSAAKAIGIDRLLDFIVEEFPSPLDRAPVDGAREGRRARRSARATRPGRSRAFVFKTRLGPVRRAHHDVPRVSAARCGPTRPLYNATQGTEERIGQLFTLRGKDHETVAEVPAGDIGAVAKLAARAHGRHARRRRTTRCQLPPSAARAAARVRDRAQDQGRRGQARDRAGAAARGGPDVPRRPERRDPRDGDLRHGRGAPRRADRAAEGEVRRRGRHRSRRRSRTARRSAARRRRRAAT